MTRLTTTFNLHRSFILMTAACWLLTGCGETAPQAQTEPSVSDVGPADSPPTEARPEGPTAATTQTETRAALNWNELPFVTESDRVLAVIKPSAMANSPAIGELVKALPIGDTDLRISPADTEWIAIYATPLVNNDQSITGMATMVIKLNRPASVYEIAESRFTADSFEEVQTANLSYLRATEKTSDDYITPAVAGPHAAVEMAIFEYDDHTFVVCEEGRLPFILEQDAAESPLKSLIAAANSDFQILVAADISDTPLVREALTATAADLSKGGVLEAIATNASSITITGDLEADALLNMSVSTVSELQSASVEQSISDFKAAAEEFLTQMESFTSPETKPLLTTAQQLLARMIVTRDVADLHLQVNTPGDMSSFYRSLQALMGQEVATVETHQ